MTRLKNISMYNLVVYITLFCNLGIIIGNPLKIDILVSICTRILIISVIIFASVELMMRIREHTIDRVIFCVCLLAIAVIIVSLMRGINIVINRYVSILCFLMIPGYIVLFYNKRCSLNIKKSIYCINYLYWIEFLYLNHSPLKYIGYSQWGTFQYEYLTLGYQNPNETGIMLMIPFIIMLCAFSDSKTRLKKFIFGIPMVHLFYMILETQSRTCILLSIFVLLAYICHKLFRISKGWVILSLILPLLTMILQVMFPHFFGNLMILGETADTGRINLWLAFKQTASGFEWIFGDIGAYGGANMHNSYLSIIAAYGIIVCILFAVFLKNALLHYCYRIEWKIRPDSKTIAFWGVLCVIIHGCAEGTFLVSGAVFAGLASLLFILALPERGNTC